MLAACGLAAGSTAAPPKPPPQSAGPRAYVAARGSVVAVSAHVHCTVGAKYVLCAKEGAGAYGAGISEQDVIAFRARAGKQAPSVLLSRAQNLPKPGPIAPASSRRPALGIGLRDGDVVAVAGTEIVCVGVKGEIGCSLGVEPARGSYAIFVGEHRVSVGQVGANGVVPLFAARD